MSRLFAAAAMIAGVWCAGCSAARAPQPVVRFVEPKQAERKWEYDTANVKVDVGLLDTKPVRRTSPGQGAENGNESTILVSLTNKRPVVGYLDARKSFSHNLAMDSSPSSSELLSKDIVFPPGYPTGIRKEICTVGQLQPLNSDVPQPKPFYFEWGGPGLGPDHHCTMPQYFSVRIVWDDGKTEDVKFALMAGPETEIAAHIDYMDKHRPAPTTQAVAQAN